MSNILECHEYSIFIMVLKVRSRYTKNKIKENHWTEIRGFAIQLDVGMNPKEEAEIDEVKVSAIWGLAVNRSIDIFK